MGIDKTELELKLIFGAKKRFEDCIKEKKNVDDCLNTALNWLRGMADYYGIKITEEEIERLKVNWRKDALQE
jgi:hypothetical protein